MGSKSLDRLFGKVSGCVDAVSAELVDLQRRISSTETHLEDETLLQNRSQLLSRVDEVLKEFRDPLEFLKIFVDCIRHWSNAEDIVPDFRSMVKKIEDEMKEIDSRLETISCKASCFCSEVCSVLLKSLFPKTCEKSELKHEQDWASQVIDGFEHSNKIMGRLKSEFSRVFYPSLQLYSDFSFQIHSPVWDFRRWIKFFLSIKNCLNLTSHDTQFGESVREKCAAITSEQKEIVDFFRRLAEDQIKLQNPVVEELMIHVAGVAVRAALVSTELYWVGCTWDSNWQNSVQTILANLLWEIDVTNPKYVGKSLRLIKIFQSTTVNQVNGVLDYLLSKELPFALRNEMINLTNTVILVSPDTEENVISFMADVRVLIAEVRSRQDLLLAGNIDQLSILRMKIWHVKIQFFLWLQLKDGYWFGFPQLLEQLRVFIGGWRNLAFTEILSLLSRTSQPLPDCKGNVEEILSLMSKLYYKVERAYYSASIFEIKRLGTEAVRDLQFNLLVKIVLLMIESILAELRDTDESLRNPLHTQIESLNYEMKWLSLLFARNQPEGIEGYEGKEILMHFRSMASCLLPVSLLSRVNKMTEEVLNKMSISISDLLDQIMRIMEMLKKKYLPSASSKFPKTNGLGFIDSFSRRLRRLQNDKADLFSYVKVPLQELVADLELLSSVLRQNLPQDREVQVLKDLVSRVADISYKAEYFIDMIMKYKNSQWHHLIWLYDLLKDLTQLKMQIKGTFQNNSNQVKVHEATQTSRTKILNAIIQSSDDCMVDLNDEEEVIIDLLIGGFLHRDIVLIFGMPGSGKTALAKKVYTNRRVEHHFHIRTWCCISQIYSKREVLLEILSHITMLTDNILKMSNEDLELKLYKLLKQNKYLIVMDDIWNPGAWDDLQRSLPNDGNGSRVLMTSRIENVLQGKSHTSTHALRPLSDDESWDLLQKKIFHQQSCPENLMDIGKQIAENCKGLPLSVVAMAGILERTEQSPDLWKRISESLSSRILDDTETRCMNILELSYNHLPDNLKECFLYFGAFQEDEVIPVQKLIRLWIAEGFVNNANNAELKNSEDLAEDYLMNLISRSLVIVAKRRSKGGVKACRVHDMLRSLCMSKAKEEDFLQLITRYSEDFPSIDGLEYDESDDTEYSNPITYEDYRLCIRTKRKHFVLSRPSGPLVRSLLFFANSDLHARSAYDVSFIFDNFKLLKVLDLKCINMGTSFPNGIKLLVFLRYLAVCGDIDSIPTSISSLGNLETFVVKGLKGNVILPYTIWFMASLRHLHVSSYLVFNLQNDKFENACQLDYLVTLSCLILSLGKNSKDLLRRLTNLKKLKCILLASAGDSMNHSQFPIFDGLAQLESLKISYLGRSLYSGDIIFPLNLKKLTLSSFGLPWDHMSAIGRLPNLEVLKLLSGAFQGETWHMIEEEFSNLKFLKLDSLNIVKWNAYSELLPKLQHLVLRSCRQLEEIPYSFVEIPTLKMIEVQWCNDSAEESARQIRDEEIEGLKVIILSDSEVTSQS